VTGAVSGPLRKQSGNHHVSDEPGVARERPAAAVDEKFIQLGWTARPEHVSRLGRSNLDMRFDPAAIRARYPDLPLTSLSDVIARIAREKDQRPH